MKLKKLTRFFITVSMIFLVACCFFTAAAADNIQPTKASLEDFVKQTAQKDNNWREFLKAEGQEDYFADSIAVYTGGSHTYYRFWQDEGTEEFLNRQSLIYVVPAYTADHRLSTVTVYKKGRFLFEFSVQYIDIQDGDRLLYDLFDFSNMAEALQRYGVKSISEMKYLMNFAGNMDICYFQTDKGPLIYNMEFKEPVMGVSDFLKQKNELNPVQSYTDPKDVPITGLPSANQSLKQPNGWMKPLAIGTGSAMAVCFIIALTVFFVKRRQKHKGH